MTWGVDSFSANIDPPSEDTPLECDAPFRRGDVDSNGKLNVTDVIKFLSYAFVGSEEVPECLDAADVNDNGKLDVTDAINSLNFQFLGIGNPPAPPGPAMCGPDVVVDDFPLCEYPPEMCR